MGKYLRPYWAEIDLDAVRRNFAKVKSYVGEGIKILGVLKADAYGIGAPEVAEVLEEAGADYIGVAVLDEALELRQNGCKTPILIFGYTPKDGLGLAVRYNITQTVYCYEMAEQISAESVKQNLTGVIQIKLETGMGRLGFSPDKETIETIKRITSLPNIRIEGIYSHFSVADELDPGNIEYTQNQITTFKNMIKELENSGIEIGIKHLCNSAGIIYWKEAHMDMVRSGIFLYGSYPIYQKVLPLEPVFSLKAKLGYIKRIGKGKNISYGRNFQTERESIIGTLPFGYGDGYTKLLTNKTHVLINGQKAPLVGNICMDQCMVDLTDIKGSIEVGDEVVVVGKQGDEEIPVEDLSFKSAGFLSYEPMVLTNKRVSRVYLKGGNIYKIKNLYI
ncbi:MAG TPA: alanine racemase [Thermoanaerobacterales bacterium]|nr:alanine racemase [Thermoanaerobacterales bacterium]